MVRTLLVMITISLLPGCAGSRAYQSVLSGDYDRAAFEYGHTLRQNPSDSRTGVLYGYCLYKGGHYEQAYQALEPLFTSRNSSFAVFWAGLAAMKMNDAEKLNMAWSQWAPAYPGDYFTVQTMRTYKAEAVSMSLKAEGFMPD